jgi:hypothetical protein
LKPCRKKPGKRRKVKGGRRKEKGQRIKDGKTLKANDYRFPFYPLSFFLSPLTDILSLFDGEEL